MLCCPTTILKWLIWNFSCTPYNLCPGYDWIILTEGIRKLEEEFLSLCDKGCLKRCIMEKVKGLPYGVARFEEVRNENFYYVDKTEFIRELLENWGEVNLFTRPRRFGKSLLMSMLKSFFGIGCRKELFDGLMIAEDKDLCERYMGKFPVISISLKGVNVAMLLSAIGTEAMQFQFLLESKNLSERERQQFAQLVSIGGVNGAAFVMSDSVSKGSLKTLTMLLEKHYGKKVILLLDEYDVPLAKANEHGYYDQMIMLVRGLFEQVLKTNDSLFLLYLPAA